MDNVKVDLQIKQEV